MATSLLVTPGAPRPLLAYGADQRFFSRMALGLSALIVLSFMQWAARGYVDPRTAPWWLHAHGAAMVAWLALLVTQNHLALTGRLGLHRKLGLSSLALLPVIVGLGLLTGYQGVALHRVPPFWTESFLLALAVVQVLAFTGLVIAGLALRRRTEWHRRLMLGAVIVIMKAALDRLLPAPLLGPSLPLWEGAVQLVAVAILAVHDRSVLGRVHPATAWIAAVVVASHLAMAGLAAFGPFIALVGRISG